MQKRDPLFLFFVLLVGFSVALSAVTVATGFNILAVLTQMWSVGLSAILAVKISGGHLSELGWRPGALRYHAIALSLPIVYSLLGYGAAAIMGAADFPAAGKAAALAQSAHFVSMPMPFALIQAILLLSTVGILQNMISALGEEIGWRGFLAPRLAAARGFLAGTLITGTLWAVWHMPLIVFSKYNGGGDMRFELMSFAVGVLAMSGPMTWLRLRSKSLWPCALMHASHNLFVQGVFDRLSERGPSTVTMVGEFGVVFAAAVLLTSLSFWIMGMRSHASTRSSFETPLRGSSG